MFTFESNGSAYFIDENNKKCNIDNVQLVEDGRIVVFDSNDKTTKVPIQHSMTWIRSNDLINDGKTLSLHEDPQIVSLAGNLVHSRGINEIDVKSDQP